MRRLDKHVRVAVDAMSQRCLLGRHTTAVVRIVVERSVDATSASFSEGEIDSGGDLSKLRHDFHLKRSRLHQLTCTVPRMPGPIATHVGVTNSDSVTEKTRKRRRPAVRQGAAADLTALRCAHDKLQRQSPLNLRKSLPSSPSRWTATCPGRFDR